LVFRVGFAAAENAPPVVVVAVTTFLKAL